MVGVKQFDMTIEVSPEDAFDLKATTFTPADGFVSPGLENGGGQVRLGAAALGDGVLDGDASLGELVLTASDSYTEGTEATITVIMISLGPSSADRDEFEAEEIGVATIVNPPVTNPALTPVGATDLSLDFSPALDEAGMLDGSVGEVTLGAHFTDAEDAPVEGHEVTWTITNNGAESVYILGDEPMVIEPATADVVVVTSADSDGLVSLTLDCEGGMESGSTSVSAIATTSAPNSIDEPVDLSLEFSITWDIPVPAELASFAGEVTGDREVLLRWGVVSQTNNLGWEVFRSTDNTVYERIGDMVPGEGTIDVFTSYEFLDSNPPLAEAIYYYLKQVDLDGSTSRSEVLTVFLGSTVVDMELVPTVTALSQNFPNPFNPETTISFDLADQAVVKLTVYDATGQTVRTLFDGEHFSAGNYRTTWDGLNQNGGSGRFRGLLLRAECR